MDNLSQASFTSATNNGRKKVFVDGELIDGEYLTKYVQYSSLIVIETPENIKNKVHGDKNTIVRLLQIYDETITAASKPYIIFMAKALRQRNNYDPTGKQTEIIGYGTYNPQINKWQLDSQFFEQDSIYPIKIQIYIDKRDGYGFQVYTVPSDNHSYIQYDIQTNYNFM